MVDGLLNKKIAFIIQARMKSTRLPGKILMPLPLGSNHPLLLWIVNALKCSKYHNNNIYIATSINKENDLLVEFCNQHNIHIFRGDEEDVLSRFTSIIKENNCDTVIRLTADNPIIDIEILDNTIGFHILNNHDYTKTEGLPIGMNFEIICSLTLLKTEGYKITEQDKEHVTLFIKNSNKYKIGNYVACNNPLLKNLRLTVDYPSDFSLISTILTQILFDSNKKNGIQLIEETFKKYPWLFNSNSNNLQKRQFENEQDEINFVVDFLLNNEFYNASNRLKKIKL